MRFPTVAIKRYARVLGGATPAADAANWGGEVNWLAPTDVSPVHGGWVGRSHRTLTEAGLADCSAQIASARSVVVTTRAPIGNVALTELPSASNQGCRTLVPGLHLNARFLRYQLQVRGEELRALGSGSTFLELSGGALGAVRVHCPPTEVQERVADFLDRESERIRELLADTRGYSEELARPALELFRRNVQAAPRGRVGYRFQIQLGKMLDEKRVESGDLLPYLRNANIHWDRIELDHLNEMTFTAADRTKFALRVGDLLVCEGGEPGRAAVWNAELTDCYYQKALHRLRPYGDDSTRFLLWALRDLADRGAFKSDGPGRYTHLTAEQLRSVRVPLPAVEEQHRTAQIVDSVARRAAQIHDQLQAMERLLAEYCDALITEAVTCTLDVTHLSDQQLDESAHAAMEGEGPEVLSA